MTRQELIDDLSIDISDKLSETIVNGLIADDKFILNLDEVLAKKLMLIAKSLVRVAEKCSESV